MLFSSDDKALLFRHRDMFSAAKAGDDKLKALKIIIKILFI